MRLISRYIFIALAVLTSCEKGSSTMVDTMVYSHQVFDPLIKSVRFHPVNRPLDLPIIRMGDRLELRFDDLGPYYRDLRYTIIHCDRYWRPSQRITNMDVMSGYDDGRIDDVVSSNATRQSYVHHRLTLPNREIGWKLSGNYILKIWDRENNDEVIMTLRFVVFEQSLTFTQLSVTPITRMGSFDQYVDLRFSLRIKNLGLDDPTNNVTAAIIQNYDWSSARIGIKPGMVTQDEIMFNRFNETVFQAHKPYRFFDLRSMLNARNGVRTLERYEDRFEANLYTDHIRSMEPRIENDWDINGGFVVSSLSPVGLQRQDPGFYINNGELTQGAPIVTSATDWRGEYVSVLFTLEDNLLPLDTPIYVLGSFNQYRPDSTSQMRYSYDHQLFFADIQLKQGVYDYMYGTVNDGMVDYSLVEGYSNVAQNDYHIIIYYTPFGERYDRALTYSGRQ